MIPKVIHYCWFGKNQLPKLAIKCIESWRKYLPDYEIIIWNEEKFDVNSNRFVSEAYKEKKWAFVSDYVRLYALFEYGGIYLDTDVEVLKNIDIFLKHKAFTGFENDKEIPTGIMGSEKDNKWVKRLLDYYEERSFYKSGGELDLRTNVEIITEITMNLGLRKKSEMQILKGDVTIYPKDFFCPKDYNTDKVNITNNTYCIHHFAGSWKDKNALHYFEKVFSIFLGKETGKKIGKEVFWKIYRIVKK